MRVKFVNTCLRGATSTMKTNVRNVKDKGQVDKNANEDKQREKKFDKKKYRLQKYSNKYKIEQWEERKKKAVLRQFYKELDKDQPKNSAETSLNLSNTSRNADEPSKSKKKGGAYFKAKREYHRKQEEKKKRIEETARRKAEREEALRKYKEKKIRNFKILSKKTRKGQPVMKGRIELLLEKIQRNAT
ncbi:thyroid transcription factor 1-associated protein 26 homolog [Monomorium pharaonis]|uniref:thyroid transcription factor 1-associated protein 26 homolog n=1 Tax=Monomorium pharaonis TaxID=307658 RepID=UPI001745CC3E|nr:thyroid transcription factor 1-associated protein 26 homolog [Monomorium pharaonis]